MSSPPKSPETSKQPARRALTETPAGETPQPALGYQANQGPSGRGTSEESTTRATRAKNRPESGWNTLVSAAKPGRTGPEQQAGRGRTSTAAPGRTEPSAPATRPTGPAQPGPATRRPDGTHPAHPAPRQARPGPTRPAAPAGRKRDLLGPPNRPEPQFIFYSSPPYRMAALGRMMALALGWAGPDTPETARLDTAAKWMPGDYPR